MHPTTRRRLALLGALLAFGTGLAACGGSPSASSTTTSSTSTTTTTSGAGQSSSQQLQALTALSKDSSTATFSATYTYRNGSRSQTITFSQAPPKFRFGTGSGGFLLYDGSKTFYCSSTVCLQSNATTNPLATITYLFDGKDFLDSVQGYAVAAAALAAAGVSLSYSSGTYAGLASQCVTITDTKTSTKTATWCVASSTGLLDYWVAGTSSFTLTAFTTSPPASDFTIPSGYTVTTIP